MLVNISMYTFAITTLIQVGKLFKLWKQGLKIESHGQTS